MINAYSPIIPFVGIGNIKLYSTRKQLQNLLSRPGTKFRDLGDGWGYYDIDDLVRLFFLEKNDKLFKITTLQGYKGKLFNKISVKTTEEELLAIEPSFKYDEFEEVFESDKGVFIETDIKTHMATWISVFVKEIYDERFEKGDW